MKTYKLFRIDPHDRKVFIDSFYSLESLKNRIKIIKNEVKQHYKFTESVNSFFGSATEHIKALNFKIEVQ